MSEKHRGACLCGAVRFEVAGNFERFYLCHCQHCRKDTGSAHAANLFSSTATLRWLSGEDQVRVFNLPATRHRHSFCATCGSALPDVQMDGAPGKRGHALQKRLFDNGLHLKSTGDTAIVAPPLIAQRAHVDEIVGLLRKALQSL